MKYKQLIYVLCAVSFFGWAGYRIYVINSENNRIVFNSERDQIKNGIPVETISVNKKTDFLYEPLVIKNNKAYVSSVRASRFKTGQNIENGTIVSISKNLDLDSGMHIIKSSGVSDGLHYVKIQHDGIFIPIDSIFDNSVMVSENGIVSKRKITVSDQDSEQALISNGLNEGDTVIVSPIKEGKKIRW